MLKSEQLKNIKNTEEEKMIDLLWNHLKREGIAQGNKWNGPMG